MGKERALPLAGVRIIEITTTIYGPYTAQILGDFGADVIKIEPPAGDPARGVGPSRSPGMGALFLGVNRNKRSVVLDLKQAPARAALWRLIEGAEIFMHNMRPQKIKALGFGEEAVRSRQPRLIYCGLHGYREDGPYAARPAYDDVIQGESGIAGLFQARDGDPAMIPAVAADKIAATIAASGILAAYIDRLRTGEGRYMECAMFEALVSQNFIDHQYGGMFRPPQGSYGYARAISPYRKPHRTKDGFICVIPYTDRQWQAFWRLAGRDDLAADPRFQTMPARSANIDALNEILGKLIAERSTGAWLAELDAAQIPAGPVNSLEDLRENEQLGAIGFFRPFDHPSEGAMEIPDTPYRFDHSSLPLRQPHPRLGEHTAEVLAEAGLSPAEIAAVAV